MHEGVTLHNITLDDTTNNAHHQLWDIKSILPELPKPVTIVAAPSLWQVFNTWEEEKQDKVFTKLTYLDAYVCLDCSNESQFGEHEYEVFLDIIKRNGIKENQILILTAGDDRRGILPEDDRIFRINVFENRTARISMPSYREITRDAVVKGLEHRTHTAISLNKRTVIHRLALAEFLMKIDNGRNYFSCPDMFWDWLPDEGEIEGTIPLTDLEERLALNESRFMYNGIGHSDFYKNLPMVVDVDKHSHGNPKDAKENEHVIFDYVSETQYDRDITFFTEKSFRPFAYRTIPIFIGTSGIVGSLRDMGYRLNAIDYSYDDIHDPFDRFKAIMEILDWTQTLSQEECKQLYMDNVDDIVHNYNLLTKRR